MGIFEQLLSNPILLFIIIAFLSSLFKKKNQEARQRQEQQQEYDNIDDYYEEVPAKEEKKRERDWDFDVFTDKIEEWEKKGRETVSTYIEPKPQPKQDTIQTMRDDLTRKRNEMKKYEISGDSPILQGDLKKSEGNVYRASKITTKEVVDGVKWAEILGQPRSRNPYKPVYQERFRAK